MTPLPNFRYPVICLLSTGEVRLVFDSFGFVSCGPRTIAGGGLSGMTVVDMDGASWRTVSAVRPQRAPMSLDSITRLLQGLDVIAYEIQPAGPISL